MLNGPGHQRDIVIVVSTSGSPRSAVLEAGNTTRPEVDRERDSGLAQKVPGATWFL